VFEIELDLIEVGLDVIEVGLDVIRGDVNLIAVFPCSGEILRCLAKYLFNCF